MPGNVYDMDSHGLQQMLDSEAILGGAMLAAAELVKAEAIRTAPYDSSHNGQHFRDSFETTTFHNPSVTSGLGRHSAVSGLVYSTDPDGMSIELGTSVGHRPHNTLSRALKVLRAPR